MRPGGALIWAAVALVAVGPVAIAAASPLQVGRGVAYVTGGMAGVAALALLWLQPLLGAGYLPGVNLAQARRWHRRLGLVLVAAVVLHIGGLFLASPPDTIDALLLVSPTPFSVYGVIALWSVVLTAVLVATRKRFDPAWWRIVHNGLALVVVVATVIHALMIEGAMGAMSKLILCLCALAATAAAILHLRVVRPLLRNR